MHQFQGRRMDRVAAKIAQKIGVLFQNQNFHTRAGEQKTEQHAGWPATDDATAGLHLFNGGSVWHLKTKRNSCFTLVEKGRNARVSAPCYWVRFGTIYFCA